MAPGMFPSQLMDPFSMTEADRFTLVNGGRTDQSGSEASRRSPRLDVGDADRAGFVGLAFAGFKRKNSFSLLA